MLIWQRICFPEYGKYADNFPECGIARAGQFHYQAPSIRVQKKKTVLGEAKPS
jgi:hypothetical protein